MIKAIIFDKDGTLFDFGGTWNVWAFGILDTLARGDAGVKSALADALDYDLRTKAFRPTSFVIAGTHGELVETLLPLLPDWSHADLDRELRQSAENAPVVPVVELAPYVADLRKMGLKLAVMTNDTENGALSHLALGGAEGLFDFVLGADSGYGAKPDPDPLLALADMMGVAPSECLMVGDSAHDLVAGKRAGMTGIGVLTGTAERDEIAPFAKIVLKDISEIPAWLQNS